MSLLVLELPGSHNLALLQGDLGMSGRNHGYRSGSIHWSGLPAVRKHSIVTLGRVLAQTPWVESWLPLPVLSSGITGKCLLMFRSFISSSAK